MAAASPAVAHGTNGALHVCVIPTEAMTLPSLPAGYSTQPAWVFLDLSGHFAYTFNRVYGPPRPHERGGAVNPLDRERSYWSVTGASANGTLEAAASIWLSYAQAKRYDARLTFARFSSPHAMHPDLPALFEARCEELREARRSLDVSGT